MEMNALVTSQEQGAARLEEREQEKESSRPLALIVKLCEALHAEGVIYCHWKSNAALDRSATGENDLDLLVGRESVQCFTAILARLGFKRVVKHPRRQMPGVLDFYGLDGPSGRLVHVHAHYQLVLGHDATKNYRIPIEAAYLASAERDGLFMVPSAEFELIILVVRLMLKHSTWDTLLMRQGGLSKSERNELAFLQERASTARMEALLEAHLPYLDRGLFAACLRSLTSGGPLLKRARLGGQLLKALSACARRPQAVDSFLKLWRRVAWPLEARLFHPDDRDRMDGGGLMTAVVGGDGAGKTTAIEGAYRWLAGNFKVKRFHMGKPKWSALTILVRGILKIGRSLGFYPFMEAEIIYTKDAGQVVFPGYPWLIREIFVARDRYLTYQKARRFATNGGLVILDRFPLPQIKFMDGPAAARMTTNLTPTRLLRFLINWEESYYQKIALPDLILLLRADPELAVRRKTDEAAEDVRARSTEIWEIDWKQTPVVEINAGRSKEEVLSDVKAMIWSRL